MYNVTKADAKWRAVVNPRRGIMRSVAGLQWHTYFQIMDELFTKFGLTGYVGSVTGEMYRRPLPHVFRTEEVAPLTSLFSKWAPHICGRVLRELRPSTQPLNKQSRLGAPEFIRPASKKEAILPYFEWIERDIAGFLASGLFTIMNVRLQTEKLSKKREFLFITADGEVYSDEVTKEQRKLILKDDKRERYASRTRLVFNMPICNLYAQCLDTAWHQVQLQYPAFHHDMYTPGGIRPLGRYVLAFDVKHFERHTAECVRVRGEHIGGLYRTIQDGMRALPFLVPSDDWKALHFITPDRAGGWSEQFASGNSAVAPAQKDILTAVYAEYAVSRLGVAQDRAIDWVWSGGDSRLTIHNYGDDNVVSGDEQAVLDDFLAFAGQYLAVEPEEPTKFLGFYWQNGRWELGVDSYLLKTWLNERAPYSVFRKFPCYGWVEKRKVYAQYGDPRIAAEVFPFEDELLGRVGKMPWSSIMEQAETEAKQLGAENFAYGMPTWLLGKDYLLTPDQKVQTGLYEGFTPQETAPILRRLIGPEWKASLSF